VRFIQNGPNIWTATASISLQWHTAASLLLTPLQEGILIRVVC